MRWVLTIAGVVLVVGLLVAVKGAQIGSLVAFGKKAQESGPPPETVSTTVAQEQIFEASLSAVGSVTAAKGVALANDAPGVVTRIAFESGQVVKEGQILVELDTSVERAQLASAIARRELAKQNAGRTRALVKSGAIGAAQADTDEAQLKTSTTDVDAIQAQIAKKTVRAPFTGRLGIRNVNLGQYLNAGTAVTVLEQIDAVFVDFTLPQQRLSDVAVGTPVRVTIGDSDADAGAPIDGKVTAIDPAVDASTRAIKVRASVPNKDERLRPGMFANVAVRLPEQATSVTVPVTALVHASFGDSVFVVEDKKPDAPGARATPDGKPITTARQQFVRVGAARGDFVALTDGVKKGEIVVTQGAFKLRNGAGIVVHNDVGATPALHPKVENR